jgi:hypothetical protein
VTNNYYFRENKDKGDNNQLIKELDEGENGNNEISPTK